MRHRLAIMLAVLFAGAAVAPAQEPALDLIPHDAGAALAIRNLKELKQKGEDLHKELGLRNDIKFSQLFEEVYKSFRVQGVVDENKPAAVMVISATSIGGQMPKELDFSILQYIVVAIPDKDRKLVAERLGFKEGELKANMVQKLPAPVGNLLGTDWVYAGNTHVYLGANAKAVEYAATAKKKLGAVLTAAQRKTYGQSDVMLQLGTFVWGKAWESILKEAGRILGEQVDVKEKEMADKIVKSMASIKSGLAGLRIEKDGLLFNLMSAWDETDNNVQEILGLLRYGDTPTTVNALPPGNLLMAEAAKGNGVANSMLARVLFKAALQKAVGADAIVTDAERPMVVGVFNEIWYNLLGNRTGLYQNTDAEKHGALALVSILDTADGKKFFDHMADLAQMADGTHPKYHQPGAKGAEEIGKLVLELNNADARTKDLVPLKLRLLGEPALAGINQASKQLNDGAKEHVKGLADEIAKLAALRKEGPAPGNWFQALRPTLQVLDKEEKRAGMTVNVMKLRLPKNAAHLADQMKHWFGPQWAELRFAIHGKNVIVFWGSNLELLDQTLKNVKDGAAGLAASQHVKTFYQKSNDDRRVEFHLSTAPLGALFQNGTLPQPADHAQSSLGLSVTPGSLQLDVWSPLSEARFITKLLGLQ